MEIFGVWKGRLVDRVVYLPINGPHRALTTNFIIFLITEIGQFQKIVGGLIEMVDELAKEAEKEKMKVHIFKILKLTMNCMNLTSCIIFLTGNRC